MGLENVELAITAEVTRLRSTVVKLVVEHQEEILKATKDAIEEKLSSTDYAQQVKLSIGRFIDEETKRVTRQVALAIVAEQAEKSLTKQVNTIRRQLGLKRLKRPITLHIDSEDY